MKKQYFFIIIVLLIIAVVGYMLVSSKPTSKEMNQQVDQLFTSIYDGNEEQVRKIIKSNKQILTKKKENKTSLDVAIEAQKYDIAIFLLEEGVKTSSSSYIAASQSLLDYEHLRRGIPDDQKKRIKYYEALIKTNKSSINKQDEYGDTALHIAARKGDIEVCQILLKHGADATIVNEQGETALQKAVGRGSLLSAKVLYENNKSLVKVQNNNGDTILHKAIQSSRYDLYDWIMQVYPDSINVQNKKGRTPLSVSAAYGDAKSVQYLILNDADKSIPSKEGLTPFDYAAKNNNAEIMQLLK